MCVCYIFSIPEEWNNQYTFLYVGISVYQIVYSAMKETVHSCDTQCTEDYYDIMLIKT